MAMLTMINYRQKLIGYLHDKKNRQLVVDGFSL